VESLIADTAQDLREHTEDSENYHHFSPLARFVHRIFNQEILDSPFVQSVTILLIIANAVVIGFETDMPDAFHWGVVESIFLAAFTFELSLRMYILTPQKYFSMANNPDITWNVFDFVIVCSGLLNCLCDVFEVAGSTWGKNATLFRMVRLLRILRVLRIIRIVRFLKQLYLLAFGFLEGTMAVFWVTLLASFVLYICSVILVRTYGRGATQGEMSHGDEFLAEHFGNIPTTMFALFVLISAPDLGPYRAVMFDNPPLVVFLVTFIILGSFGINGLLVALINESILEKNQARIEAERMEREAKRKEMQQRCREIFDGLDVNKNRVLPRSELVNCTDQIASVFESLGVNFQRNDLTQMFYIMDYNDTGIIERSEFVQGVVELCDQIRPMSIMELHYQVSKCASKIEYCELKVGELQATVNSSDMKLDALVRNVSDDACSGLSQSEGGSLNFQANYWSERSNCGDTGGQPMISRSHSAPEANSSSSDAASSSTRAPPTTLGPSRPKDLRSRLTEHVRHLKEAQSRIDSFVRSSLTAKRKEKQKAEGETLPEEKERQKSDLQILPELFPVLEEVPQERAASKNDGRGVRFASESSTPPEPEPQSPATPTSPAKPSQEALMAVAESLMRLQRSNAEALEAVWGELSSSWRSAARESSSPPTPTARDFVFELPPPPLTRIGAPKSV